jgi:GMP synthase-like glutamine amidotransferase
MKPVAIFQFSPTEGPGYLAEFLDARTIPWQLIRSDEGHTVPTSTAELSGIAMMGGPMSVNDPLPWIPQLHELIREAVDRDVPLIGHCLGGQLIATALGGRVTDNHCMEVGWHAVDIVGGEAARPWFGGLGSFITFQWHYQTFSIPPGATRVLGNAHCVNQAFVLGPHIGFQCHIEMTADMVRAWVGSDSAEIRAAGQFPSVQTPEEILRGLESRVTALNRVADGVYTRWIDHLTI